MARELLLVGGMKLLALAALAMTAGACTDTTTVYGSWRADSSAAGSCQTFLFATDVHVTIYNEVGGQIASEDAACDDLGFTAEIPVDVTRVRVTATDPWSGTWEHSFDIVDGYLDVGTILFDHGSSGD